jgi:hypothetical protein
MPQIGQITEIMTDGSIQQTTLAETGKQTIMFQAQPNIRGYHNFPQMDLDIDSICLCNNFY